MMQFLIKKIHNLFSDQRFSEILTGSVWALGARVVATVLGLMFSVLVARYYGAEIVGIVALVNSFLMLVTTFTVFGTSTSILRLIPEHISKYSPTSAFKIYLKTQYMVIGFSVITGIISFFCAELIAGKLFSKVDLSYYFALASIFVVFRSMMELNSQAVRGLRLIRLFAVMQVLPQTFNLSILIAVGLFWPSNDVPIYALLVGFALTGIAGWFISEKAFKKIMKPCDREFPLKGSAILSLSLPMLMTAAMTFFIGETGILMLGVFRPGSEVGYYAIALKLATLTTFVLSAINSMAAPKFSELFYMGKIDDLFYVAKKSAELIFFITTPILIILLIFGKAILSFVFGQDFAIAYTALIFLLIGQFINSISGSTGFFMNMTGNQAAFRNIMAVAACLNIGLNLWFIPFWGIRGAALSAMICMCFWNISTLLYIKRKFGKSTGYFPLLN